MVFLFNKIYCFFCNLFLYHEIRKNHFEKIVALKFSSDSIIKNWFPIFPVIRPSLDGSNIDTLLYPAKQCFIRVGNLNTYSWQLPNMPFAVNNTSNISDFCLGDFRNIERNIAFERFGLKRIGTRMRTIFTFSHFYFAKMYMYFLATTKAISSNFWFSIPFPPIRVSSLPFSHTLVRTKSLLPFIQFFITLFTIRHISILQVDNQMSIKKVIL